MKGSQVAELVAMLIASFPYSKADAKTSAIYERMLLDLNHAAALDAIEKLIATSRFLPTIAEIRETALAATVGEVKRGGEAWGEVQRLLARYGARRYDLGWKPPIADPVAAQVVAALGWVALCDSENQVSDRARFIDLYDQIAARDRRGQVSAPVAKALRGDVAAAEPLSLVANLARRLGGGS